MNIYIKKIGRARNEKAGKRNSQIIGLSSIQINLSGDVSQTLFYSFKE